MSATTRGVPSRQVVEGQHPDWCDLRLCEPSEHNTLHQGRESAFYVQGGEVRVSAALIHPEDRLAGVDHGRPRVLFTVDFFAAGGTLVGTAWLEPHELRRLADLAGEYADVLDSEQQHTHWTDAAGTATGNAR